VSPLDVSPHCLPLDDFSFAMDIEVALPLGNIGDETEACGNSKTGFTCAAPEYAEGARGLLFDQYFVCVLLLDS
jgi:hypothetical protein